MPLTVAQAFSRFLGEITATKHQAPVLIPARIKSVNEDLGSAFPTTSDLPFTDTILMGSASRATVIRPIDDVDVLAIFSNENDAWSRYKNDSQSFIYRIRNAYDGYKVQQVGTRGQAVRVFCESGGHVYGAPVFSTGNNVYQLPNGTGGWLSTSPTLANSWFSTRDRELGNNLAPLVRLLKRWNRAHSKRLRSFHVKTVVGSAFDSLNGNYRDALQKFFEWAPCNLGVSDPGGHGGRLDSYLTLVDALLVSQALSSAAERAKLANEAEARGNHEE